MQTLKRNGRDPHRSAQCKRETLSEIDSIVAGGMAIPSAAGSFADPDRRDATLRRGPELVADYGSF
jgi:hypothetical protein